MSYKNYKFAYFGSPRFSRIILENILQYKIYPDILICNPDKPVGRKKIIIPPETKKFLIENGLYKKIKIFQPENKIELIQNKNIFKDLDFGIVAAYSKIIPQEIIDEFKHGLIGVHPSLLPKYRGPSPIQYTILNGDKESGTTLFLIDFGIDTGKIIIAEKIQLCENESYLTLEKKLAELGGKLLHKNLNAFLNKKITVEKQNDKIAITTKKIKTEDGFVNLEKDKPISIYRKIKALNPEPGVFTYINGVRTKLLEAKNNHDNIIITKILPAGKKERKTNIIIVE